MSRSNLIKSRSSWIAAFRVLRLRATSRFRAGCLQRNGGSSRLRFPWVANWRRHRTSPFCFDRITNFFAKSTRRAYAGAAKARNCVYLPLIPILGPFGGNRLIVALNAIAPACPTFSIWDIETVPDLRGLRSANYLDGNDAI